jgi:hypothetical protein
VVSGDAAQRRPTSCGEAPPATCARHHDSVKSTALYAALAVIGAAVDVAVAVNVRK